MTRVLFPIIALCAGCSSTETVVAPPATPTRQQPPTATTQKFELTRFESASPAPSGGSPTSAPPPASASVPAPRAQSCSGWPRGTEVGVEDTTRGAAMVFTTEDDIEALRARVAEQRETTSVGYAVHLDNVRQGIRVVFEPKAGEKEPLRTAISQRARELSKACGLAWDTREEEPEEKPSRKAPSSVSEPPIPWLEPDANKKTEAKGKPEPAKSDDKKEEKKDEKADDKKPDDKKPEAKKPEDDKKPDDKKPGEDKPTPPKDGDKPKDPFAPPQPKP